MVLQGYNSANPESFNDLCVYEVRTKSNISDLGEK